MENVRLSEQPEIRELFTVLQEHKLEKELVEVKGLLTYMEDMEEQMGLVMGELRQVNQQLIQINDHTVKGVTEKIVTEVHHEVRQLQDQVQRAGNSVIQSAEHIVDAGKQKGIGGVKKAIRLMKVTPMLGYLKQSCHKVAQRLEKVAGKVETIRIEAHAARGHHKNIGRALIGKPIADPVQADKDNGILAAIRKSYHSMGKTFEKMERWSEKAARSVSAFENSSSEKKSVKDELKNIKAGQSGRKVQTPQPQKGETR